MSSRPSSLGRPRLILVVLVGAALLLIASLVVGTACPVSTHDVSTSVILAVDARRVSIDCVRSSFDGAAARGRLRSSRADERCFEPLPFDGFTQAGCARVEQSGARIAVMVDASGGLAPREEYRRAVSRFLVDVIDGVARCGPGAPVDCFVGGGPIPCPAGTTERPRTRMWSRP